MVDETADALLAELTPNRSASPYGGALAALALQREDRRSREQFLSSVEEWREEATQKADEVTDEFLPHQLARGHWTIYNESDRYLEAVRAQVDFPRGVVVLMASDTDYCDHGGPFNPRAMLPKPPAKWRTLRPFDIAGLLAAPGPESRQPPAMARDPEFEVERTTDATRLTWRVGDLPPRSSEWGNERFAVVTDNHLSEVEVRWRVTARGVNHVFEGTSKIGRAQDHGVHLTWTRPAVSEDESA